MPQTIAEAIEAIEAIMALIDLTEEDYLKLSDVRLSLLVKEANEKEQRLRDLL